MSLSRPKGYSTHIDSLTSHKSMVSSFTTGQSRTSGTDTGKKQELFGNSLLIALIFYETGDKSS